MTARVWAIARASCQGLYNAIEAKIFCLIAIKLKTNDLLTNLNRILYIVTYKNQLEIAPLKNLFFLAFLKLYVKDSFGCNKESERMGKTFPAI